MEGNPVNRVDPSGRCSPSLCQNEDNKIFPDVIRPWEFSNMDAFGIRGNLSAALVGGGGVNFDLIGNLRSRELSFFFSPGLMTGVVFGADASVGVLEVANLPNNSLYQEISVAGGGTIATPEFPLGGVIEFSSIPPAVDNRLLCEKPQTWFGGYSFGAELGAYVSPSYAIEIFRISPYGDFVLFP